MKRRLAAILCADMVGYSRRMAIGETGTLLRLKQLRDQVIDPAIAHSRGRLVKSTGDGVLAEFPSVVDAVRCAVGIQLDLAGRNDPLAPDDRIFYRIGINLGEIVIEDGDIFGDGVNIAARLEQLAEPGGLCVSRSVFEQANGKVASGFSDIGLQRLRNIPDPVHAYRVEMRPETAEPPAPPSVRPRQTVLAALAAVAVLIAGSAAYFYTSFPNTPGDSPKVQETRQLEDLPSIAVLPFENMSGDAQQAFLADGITDDITIHLTKAPGLLVIDRDSVFSLRGDSADLAKVAATLGVRFLLKGSVRRADDALRLNATLIDVQTGELVWAESYDGPMADVFALQTRIATDIVAALSDAPESAVPVAESAVGTDNLQAYELFLKGRERFLRFSREDTFAARRYLERAVAEDPGFSDAYALLGWTHAFEYNNGWAPVPDEALSAALALEDQALALNDRLPVAHFVKALVHRERKQYDLAMSEATQAIAINPNYANAYIMIATLLYYGGLPEDGLRMIEEAERLNPLHPSNYPFHKGQALFILERYDEAAEVLTRGLQQNPTSQRMRVWLAATYAAMARTDDARWEAEQILLDDPDFRLSHLHDVFPFTDPAAYDRFRAALAEAGFSKHM